MVERMEERGSNWFPENDGKRDLVMVKNPMGNNNIYGYKKIGPANFLVTDAENASIMVGRISDKLAIEGFMSQGFDNSDGTWRVIVSSSVSKKTDADGAERLTELLDQEGFKAE
ncbi:MAG: hypothetical protein AAB580_01570, partial [Patescibacteria group bacterium]